MEVVSGEDGYSFIQTGNPSEQIQFAPCAVASTSRLQQYNNNTSSSAMQCSTVTGSRYQMVDFTTNSNQSCHKEVSFEEELEFPCFQAQTISYLSNTQSFSHADHHDHSQDESRGESDEDALLQVEAVLEDSNGSHQYQVDENGNLQDDLVQDDDSGMLEDHAGNLDPSDTELEESGEIIEFNTDPSLNEVISHAQKQYDKDISNGVQTKSQSEATSSRDTSIDQKTRYQSESKSLFLSDDLDRDSLKCCRLVEDSTIEAKSQYKSCLQLEIDASESPIGCKSDLSSLKQAKSDLEINTTSGDTETDSAVFKCESVPLAEMPLDAPEIGLMPPGETENESIQLVLTNNDPMSPSMSLSNTENESIPSRATGSETIPPCKTESDSISYDNTEDESTPLFETENRPEPMLSYEPACKSMPLVKPSNESMSMEDTSKESISVCEQTGKSMPLVDTGSDSVTSSSNSSEGQLSEEEENILHELILPPLQTSLA